MATRLFRQGRTGAPPAHRRRHDGVQEGARGDRRRHGQGRRVLRKKGIAKAEKRAGKQTQRGLIGQLHPPQRQGRRAGGAELRDRLRRPHRRLQDTRARAWPSTSPAPHLSANVDKDGVPQRQARARARASSKSRRAPPASPSNLIQKIVDGKVEAYYKDVALLHQPWVREPKKSIGDLVKEASARPRWARTSSCAAS
jgi:elongation factor Ts